MGQRVAPPKGAGNYLQRLKVDKFEYTSPVGSFVAYKHGLHDMGGNVWEWCEDKYSPTGTDRVLRGALWGNGGDAEGLLSSHRDLNDPDRRGSLSGFRCVLASE